ncbi:acetyl-CoA synthetase-like protein [Auricularia subglabra TFB-10046 SS5]|nr:acetyl-CoA synthetase-like protein [Auricularia subglabra TFB-10046 SS5]
MATPRNAVTILGAGAPLFVPPPFDNSIPYAEYVDWHMTRSSDHELVRLVHAGDEPHRSITMHEFGAAVHTLGRHFLNRVPTDLHGPMVVPIVLSAHSLLYMTVMVSLLRAGFQPFPIAPTMPEPALRHLLQKTQAKVIVASVDGGQVLPTVAGILKDPGFRAISSLALDDLYTSLTQKGARVEVSVPALLPPISDLCPWSRAYSWDDLPTFIIHTSGSTDLPKAIPLRQKALASWFLSGWFGDFDMSGCVLPAGFLPPFHITAIAVFLAVPLACGIHIALDHPSGPVTPTTPSGILQFFKRAQAGFVLVPPILCEVWSMDNEAIEYLATMRLVAVGTAALKQNVGDKLVSGGVPLFSSYGSTEGGQLWQFRRSVSNDDWAYGRFAPYVDRRLVPVGVNRFRVELLETENYSPALLNTSDSIAFDTHDIVESHPQNSELFKVVDRDDNQLVLVTGETVLVAQLENTIRQCPQVKQVAVFGHGRPQLGLLVEPRDALHCAGGGSVEFRNLLRPYVLQANALVPPHSQIPTDLIVVTGPGTTIPVSAKGTVPRALVVKMFAQQIEAAYRNAEDTRSQFSPPPTWTRDDIQDFVTRTVHGIVSGLVSDAALDQDEDLFRQGCTSIHSAYIRNALANGAAALGKARSTIPPNVVYVYPTISQLSAFLYNLDAENPATVPVAEKLQHMADLVARFTADLPKRRSARLEPNAGPQPGGKTVLLTGSTGALGTCILSQLLADATVVTVFILVRQVHGLERQVKALIDRGVMSPELDIKKLRVLQGDVCQPRFGIPEEDWQELLRQVTAVVHCAWRLDFNLGLESFVPHLTGIRNIVTLISGSLQPAAPSLVFTSSLDTIRHWSEERLVPEDLLNAEYAVGSGYGESKWISDQILARAANEIGLSVTTIRISQLSGIRGNGSWNTSDWVPQVLRASAALGAVPANHDGNLSWLPLDVAAKAIVHVMNSPAPGFRMLNLEHPKSVQWREIFSQLAKSVARDTNRPMEAVTRAAWIKRIGEADAKRDGLAPERNATLHIAQLLRDGWASRWEKLGNDASNVRDATGFAHLEMSKMLSVYPELAACAPVDEQDVDKWVKYWAAHGLFAGLA